MCPPLGAMLFARPGSIATTRSLSAATLGVGSGSSLDHVDERGTGLSDGIDDARPERWCATSRRRRSSATMTHLRASRRARPMPSRTPPSIRGACVKLALYGTLAYGGGENAQAGKRWPHWYAPSGAWVRTRCQASWCRARRRKNARTSRRYERAAADAEDAARMVEVAAIDGRRGSCLPSDQGADAVIHAEAIQAIPFDASQRDRGEAFLVRG